MNKQNSTTISRTTRTVVGVSMMALAMISITACGSNKNSDPTTGGTTTGSTVGEPNGTTPPATTGGTTAGTTTVVNPNAPITGGNTTGGAGISGNQNGVAVSLPYAVLQVNTAATTPSEAYGVEFLSYNPYCFYAANPDPNYTTTPNSFQAMAVYLGSTAPTAGSYTVGGALTAIDPNSGFEIATACAATGVKLGTGSSISFTAIDTTAKTASGMATVTLSDGTALTGSFTTTSSCDAPTPAATAAAPVCTTITYK